MDAPLRSNGSGTRSGLAAQPRTAPKSRVAVRVERVLNTTLGGERAAVLAATAGELLGEAEPVARVLSDALDRPGVGVVGHWLVQELLRRSNLYDDLLNSLASPNPVTRAAAAQICGAARMIDAVLWLGDLLDDPSPRVRESAVRSLAQVGGRRAIELLVGSADEIPLHRLAISIARGASDVDIEALMRRPVSEKAAVATVLACGLRRDVLRVSPLLGIAHDRRWPKQVRLAACKALAAIGDRAAADALRRLADTDPDEDVRKTAERAHVRLVKAAPAR